ncbi:MAG: hypothetical protein PHU62_08890 [Bacteroidales bacterium]|jgi:D-alanine-D-alanine ligase|nr:hypothetical protein [Bacteroidales bacterium]MDD2205147.1 hypothetical protein [Bacteroidales bacterium]MDD3914882.1 hypothetical protein [Bacteroidales bacterium]MDD4634667.1 hypothetical protein [Bacteroidales bacterium]
MKILILRDDISHSDSIDELDNKEEADFAEEYLSKKHEVIQIPFISDLQIIMDRIKEFSPDVVFNLVESVCGNGAMSVIAVQMLQSMGVPFTGNNMYAQLISSDKALAKRLLRQSSIPTPTSAFKHDVEYILKMKGEHASMYLDDNCIRSFSTAEQMRNALQEKENSTGAKWIAEQYIDGREFNCAILGDIILPPAEIHFQDEFLGHKILTYEAKWNENAISYQQSLRTFDFEDKIKNRLATLMKMCAINLELRGYARVDFRMDKYENLYAIDINTNPCISPDSGFVAMVLHQGLTIEDMFDKIINDAFIS